MPKTEDMLYEVEGNKSYNMQSEKHSENINVK
jgi:hypothetical protein